MELYIGGYAQGKLEYVFQTHPGQQFVIADEDIMNGKDKTGNTKMQDKRIILDKLHLWVQKWLEQGEDPEKLIEEFWEKYPDCIIISDEIGNGIVPIRQQEREFRERLGRIQIEIAKRAERVERVICGLGQRLK